MKRAKKAKASPAKAEKKVKKEGPKKANPYMMFSSANRAEVIKANPDAAVTEVAKLLGAKWQELSEKEKDSWKAKAAAQTAKNAKEFKPSKK